METRMKIKGETWIAQGLHMFDLQSLTNYTQILIFRIRNWPHIEKNVCQRFTGAQRQTSIYINSTTSLFRQKLPAGGDIESMDARDTLRDTGDPGTCNNNMEKTHITGHTTCTWTELN